MGLIQIAATLSLFIAAAADGYRILGLFPHPGRSHFNVFEPLLKALARKGHNVTVMSHFPQKSPLINYTDIDISDTHPPLIDIMHLEDFHEGYWAHFSVIFNATDLGVSMCEKSLSAEVTKKLVNPDNKFDLIIMEFLNTDCMAGFSYLFNAPLIGICSAGMNSFLNARVANPASPAYIVNLLLEAHPNMGFIDRLANTLFYLGMEMVYKFKMEPENEKVTRKYFGDEMPPLRAIMENSSLILINEHVSLNTAKPFVPSVIPVGGIHIGNVERTPKVNIYTAVSFRCLLKFKITDLFSLFLQLASEVHLTSANMFNNIFNKCCIRHIVHKQI